jgi:hypothetical protein
MRSIIVLLVLSLAACNASRDSSPAHAGITDSDAEALLQALKTAEAVVPAERLARIAAFRGVVRMYGSSHRESVQ